jgi:hypothetical protein
LKEEGMTMKTGFVAVVSAILLLAGAMTGVALAGEDPNRDLSFSSNWQVEGPIETGAIPDTSESTKMDSGMSSDDAGPAVVEFGDVRYRVGLDAGA